MTFTELIKLFGPGTEEVETVPEWPLSYHMDSGEVVQLAREYERKTGQRLDRPGKG